MPEYVTKDSGARQEFETGSRRDTQDGKPRIDLISPHALTRWGGLMGRGADKYGERNWEKGQPLTRYEASLFRHVVAYMLGDREEDHLAAVLFNAGGIIDHEERIARGELAAELDDRPAPRRPERAPSYAASEHERRCGGVLADYPNRYPYHVGDDGEPCVSCGITRENAQLAGHPFRRPSEVSS